MKNGRELSHDLNRLVAASLMYARQQSDRVLFGDDQENEDVIRETHELVTDVLKKTEHSLDEDFVESLDRGNYARAFWPWDAWRNPFGSSRYTAFSPKVAFGRREETMLQEILEDFRANVQAKLRKARRDDRSLTDDEIDQLLNDLREDLKVVARRTRRKEERRESDELEKS